MNQISWPSAVLLIVSLLILGALIYFDKPNVAAFIGIVTTVFGHLMPPVAAPKPEVKP